MRVLKICAVVALVLAFGSMAQADLTSQLAWDYGVIADNMGDTWPDHIHIQFNIIDWSIGRTYGLDPGDVVKGADNVNDLPDAQGNWPQPALPNPIDPDEDSWSIIKIREILVDELTNPNSPAMWSDAVDDNWEIVGIVYGGVDVVVEVQADGTQVVGTVGEKFAFFIQPEGTLDVVLGSSGRVAAQANPFGIPVGDAMYNGVGFDAAGNPLAAGTVELGLLGIAPNDKMVAGTDVARRSEFIPDLTQPGAGVGESSEFLDIIAGTWQNMPFPALEGKDWYFGPGTVPAGYDDRHGDSETGDLHQENTFKPYKQLFQDDDWSTSSKDPTVGAAPIPEPLTVVGALMALSTLGGYIRKRRTA